MTATHNGSIPVTFWQSAQLSLRASAAAIVSLLGAAMLELPFPIYAFIAAVIVTDLQADVSRRLGLRRLAATIIGASCGALLAPLLPAGAWGIGAGTLVSMLAAQLLGAREGARVAGYICGIILLDHGAAPWAYALHRFLETALGVGAAWAISFVPKLMRTGDAPGA